MKMKTKKIVAKRFKVSAGGKILRHRQNARHLRSHKSKKQIRRLKSIAHVSHAMERTIRTFLPYS